MKRAISIWVITLLSAFSMGQHGGVRYPGLELHPGPEFIKKSDKESIRIPYRKGSRFGFLDERGEPVISAIYPQVLHFSEGLAGVRYESGKFGYIDEQGDQVIPPILDEAGDFRGEYALAKKDGAFVIVHRNGLFEDGSAFNNIYRTHIPSWFKARSHAGNYGLIDATGNLLLDTIYSDLSVNKEGFVFLEAADGKAPTILNHELDTVALPPSLRPLDNFDEGFAPIELLGDSGRAPFIGIINTEGVPVFVDSARFKIEEYGIFQDSLVIVSSETKGLGWVNLEGKFLAFDDDWSEVAAIGRNRAWVREDGLWKLVDIYGNPVSRRPFKEIYRNMDPSTCDLFHHGFELALGFEGWCAIDSVGELVAGPLYEDPEGIFSREETAVISLKRMHADSTTYYEYMIWDIYSDKLISGKYDGFDWFDGGLRYFMMETHKTKKLVDRRGRILWSQTDPRMPSLNSAYMNRGYFYASSPPKKKYAGFGGWGGSVNSYRPISTTSGTRDLILEVRTDPDTVFADSYSGHKVRLMNTTKDTAIFNAQDSRLYMNVQARDKKGRWRDIEYLPSSWCGNSYHQLYLPPDCEWVFVTPSYEGARKTEFRIKLVYKKGDKDKLIYSNTYTGSVNPSQFHQKPGYNPVGIMDPYNE